MTDNIIPPWQFEATCPQCGSKLFLKRETESRPIEVEPDERLFCPNHGDTMSIEEAHRIAFDDHKDEIIDKVKKFALDSLRSSFGKKPGLQRFHSKTFAQWSTL